MVAVSLVIQTKYRTKVDHLRSFFFFNEHSIGEKINKFKSARRSMSFFFMILRLYEITIDDEKTIFLTDDGVHNKSFVWSSFNWITFFGEILGSVTSTDFMYVLRMDKKDNDRNILMKYIWSIENRTVSLMTLFMFYHDKTWMSDVVFFKRIIIMNSRFSDMSTDQDQVV